MLQRRQPAKLGDALQEVEDSVKADQVLINSLPVGLSTDGKGNELRQRTLREAKNPVSFPPQLRLGRAVCQSSGQRFIYLICKESMGDSFAELLKHREVLGMVYYPWEGEKMYAK